jgi:hypothetical protein
MFMWCMGCIGRNNMKKYNDVIGCIIALISVWVGGYFIEVYESSGFFPLYAIMFTMCVGVVFGLSMFGGVDKN